MNIFVPKETNPRENRVALTPQSVVKLVAEGAQITIETGLGNKCGYQDQDYQKAGAKVTKDRNKELKESQMVLRIRLPQVSTGITLRHPISNVFLFFYLLFGT